VVRALRRKLGAWLEAEVVGGLKGILIALPMCESVRSVPARTYVRKVRLSKWVKNIDSLRPFDSLRIFARDGRFAAKIMVQGSSKEARRQLRLLFGAAAERVVAAVVIARLIR
jgi:hypothetical protein